MYPLIKHSIDFFAALIGLFLLSPILLVTTIVLKLTGEGKIFFTQQRIGYKNKPFKIWKFITMVSNAHQAVDGTVTGKNDMRITPIGAFLRNSKIDEFPQLFNVLRGDMSFVGPRPLMEKPDFESYPKEVQDVIYNVRPGITAIGSVVFRDEGALITQVKEDGGDAGAFKSKVIFPYKGRLEMWYNENQSFWVDLKILFLTAWTLIFSTSQLAYKAFKGLPERTATLSVEFDRMEQLRESITLLLVVIFVLIPIVPSPFWFWNNPQFVLMAIIPVWWFGYIQFGKAEIPIKVIPTDIYWLVFISISFLSYCWAINGSLVWYQAFGWLVLILWMFLFRSLSTRKTAEKIMPTLFMFFFLAMLLHHFLALFVNVQTDGHWNYFFGKNANYTSCFLVSLYPYILFLKSKHRILILLKIIATVGVLYILLITKTKWALIAFLIIGLYYIWTYLTKQWFNILLGVITITLFFINIPTVFGGIDITRIPLLKEFSGTTELFKSYLLGASIRIAQENPLLGVGLGNWQLVVYQLGINGIPPFDDPSSFIRFRSHNLYTKHLVELGLVGLVAFLSPILLAIRKGWDTTTSFDDFHKAAYASLLVYFITACFYNDVNSYEYHFSGLQLLAFCALGILTSTEQRFYTVPNWANYILLFLSILGLAWFGYTKYSYDQYWSGKRAMINGQVDTAIKQLENVYNPVFKTANGFEERLSYNKLITLDLAKLYEQKNNIGKAEENYLLALKQAPYNEKTLLQYARFLLEHKNQIDQAKKYADKVYVIQHNNYEVNLLLVEIAIAGKQWEVAKKHLEIFEEKPSKKHSQQVDSLKNIILQHSSH